MRFFDGKRCLPGMRKTKGPGDLFFTEFSPGIDGAAAGYNRCLFAGRLQPGTWSEPAGCISEPGRPVRTGCISEPGRPVRAGGVPEPAGPVWTGCIPESAGSIWTESISESTGAISAEPISESVGILCAAGKPGSRLQSLYEA